MKMTNEFGVEVEFCGTEWHNNPLCRDSSSNK